MFPGNREHRFFVTMLPVKENICSEKTEYGVSTNYQTATCRSRASIFHSPKVHQGQRIFASKSASKISKRNFRKYVTDRRNSGVQLFALILTFHNFCLPEFLLEFSGSGSSKMCRSSGTPASVHRSIFIYKIPMLTKS